MSETTPTTEGAELIEQLVAERGRLRRDFQIAFVMAFLSGALALGFAADGKRATGAWIMLIICVICLAGGLLAYRRYRVDLAGAIKDLRRAQPALEPGLPHQPEPAEAPPASTPEEIWRAQAGAARRRSEAIARAEREQRTQPRRR